MGNVGEILKSALGFAVFGWLYPAWIGATALQDIGKEVEGMAENLQEALDLIIEHLQGEVDTEPEYPPEWDQGEDTDVFQEPVKRSKRGVDLELLNLHKPENRKN